jgi:ribosomal protein S18 acetylase RimI-like enzyme
LYSVRYNLKPDISRNYDSIEGWQLMSTDNPETGVRAAQESDLAAVYDVWYRTDVLADDLTTPPEKGPVPAYLRHVLATGKLVVAERNGDIVGFAGAVTRGEVVFLTDLFVDPLHQSGSLGKTLLRAALPGGDGLVHCTLSSSDPRAQALYIRAGMAPDWPYFGLRLDVSATSVQAQEPQDVEIREALASDIPELVKVDTERSGRCRPQEHTFWMQQEQAVPLWFRRQDGPIGYAYVRLGAGTIWHPRACTIGPVGAATAEEATACVLAAVEWAAERAPVLRIGVPGPHGSLALLLERGFEITYVDTFVSGAAVPFFDPRRYIPSGGDLL